MVLHQNKWDKKAKRAHVRRLKAKGKEDDTKKPADRKAKPDRDTKVDETSLPSKPKRADDETSESESEEEDESVSGSGSGSGSEEEELKGEDVKEDEAEPEGEEKGGASYSRRKMQSNAWRYEEEDPEFPLDKDPSQPPPEPEPDYASLTRDRITKLDAPAAELDLDFLHASQKARGGPPLRFDDERKNVVKVKREDFQEVTEKIKKQNNVEAFRARFARSGAGTKKRVEEDVDIDDVDAFLGSLDVGVAGGKKAEREDVERDTGRKEREGDRAKKKVEVEDEWLDSMLAGR